MRLTLSTLALILAPLSINAAASKNDFMQAMRSTKINNNNKKDRKARLNASILASAKPVPPSNALPLTSTSTRKTRSLYYDDAVAADDAAAADAADDAVAADDGAAAADDEDYSEYGFEMSSYSMKYAGCSSIATFSDELAEDEDAETVFEIDQYAVFRFCPSDTCSDSSISGCSSDYGEYMVPLETWLTIIAEYRDEEFERYCEYCAACYGTDDDASAANCAYKTACSGYADVCNDDYVDYSGFFECREYDASDDLIVYLGPHCAADKATIVLAVFDDAYCSEYSSDSYDIGTLTGGVLTSESLAEYYEEECIACKESDLSFQNYDGDNEDSDDITEVCETLYGYAAKCNRQISGATSSSYQSYEQEDNEYTVCSFIASVVTGTYDENGYIYVNPSNFAADNKYNEYSHKAIRTGVVTGSQVTAILVFVALLVGMGVHALYLNMEIKEKSAFAASTREPLAMNRQNSGIMMARSTTVDSTYKAPVNTGQLA